jgi:hypothetical protein
VGPDYGKIPLKALAQLLVELRESDADVLALVMKREKHYLNRIRFEIDKNRSVLCLVHDVAHSTMSPSDKSPKPQTPQTNGMCVCVCVCVCVCNLCQRERRGRKGLRFNVVRPKGLKDRVRQLKEEAAEAAGVLDDDDDAAVLGASSNGVAVANDVVWADRSAETIGFQELLLALGLLSCEHTTPPDPACLCTRPLRPCIPGRARMVHPSDPQPSGR